MNDSNHHKPTVLLLTQKGMNAPENASATGVVEAVVGALEENGFDCACLALGWDLGELEAALREKKPTLAFNLIDGLQGHGRLVHVVPAALDALGLPYTGATSDALYQTSLRPMAKAMLRAKEIATPAWHDAPVHDPSRIAFEPPYIVKPLWKGESRGLDDQSVVRDKAGLREAMATHRHCYVEAYVTGREFHVALLGDASGVEVLPVAEIRFEGYDSKRPAILGYQAKCETGSFAYEHTVRSFEVFPQDKELVRRLSRIAVRCWKLFRLRGHALVSFRVDALGEPLVVEVNANPSLSAAGSFVAAASQAKLPFHRLIGRIIADCPIGI